MKTPVINQQDIRDSIFSTIADQIFVADIRVERDGILAGVTRLKPALLEIGVTIDYLAEDGGAVKAGDVVVTISGSPKQMALAEEFAMGLLAKTSGIATAARRAVTLAGGELRIVAGAWKKVAPELKWSVREAVATGGAAFRISDQPFLYLDKNFVRMLGGIRETLAVVAAMDDKIKSIQVKGESGDILDEALLAVHSGADILMVDTGNLHDVLRINQLLIQTNQRHKIKIAFARGIGVEAIPSLKGLGIDILDIGTGIIDAPLLDMKLDVRKRG